MTSERLCAGHPPARSPRTALQKGGFGAALQLAINDAGCAKPAAGSSTKASSAKPARVVSEVFMNGPAAFAVRDFVGFANGADRDFFASRLLRLCAREDVAELVAI